MFVRNYHLPATGFARFNFGSDALAPPMEIVLGIITVILLVAVIVLLALSLRAKEKRSELGQVEELLRRNAKDLSDSVAKQIADGATEQFARFNIIQQSVNDTLARNRNEMNDSLRVSLNQVNATLENKINTLRDGTEKSLAQVNATLENKISSLQDSNEKRLEKMQNVVDEKLQKTLNERLSQSFEQVGNQLNSVQQGLGEMKSLAEDAKSLKNALINVKERGTYGEVRLEKLLSDILAPSQYVANVQIKAKEGAQPATWVEFAVKFPGHNDVPTLLPIDSKFPIEDYNRLLDANDKPAIEDARRGLYLKFRSFAKEIGEKYIAVPKTTDFALMFLPTEGLYAELVQNASLFEELRTKYKITAVGPSTLSAFLGSMQVGFKTLAIEKRSQEVWDTLGKVKEEFGKFGGMLEQAHKRIKATDKDFEEILGPRTRAIQRSLKGVETLSEGQNVQGAPLAIPDAEE